MRINQEYLEVHMPPPKVKQDGQVNKKSESSGLERKPSNEEEITPREKTPSAKKDPKEYKIGQYLIQKTLGEGTFGKVKLGKHIITG